MGLSEGVISKLWKQLRLVRRAGRTGSTAGETPAATVLSDGGRNENEDDDEDDWEDQMVEKSIAMEAGCRRFYGDAIYRNLNYA